MKRFFLSLLAAAGLTAPSLAQQVPNGGFETWTAVNALERAQNWQNTDDILREGFGLGVLTETVVKTTDKYAGSFAAKLETKNPSFLGPVAGYLILGNRLNVATGSFGGLPFTGRPAALQLRYKLTGANAALDSASVSITLTRSINGQSQPVGAGAFLFRPSATYALATVPVQYSSTQAPDSIRIIINSGTSDVITPGTTLTVDDLTLTNSVTANRPEATAPHLTAYPNPSADGRFTLETREEPALLRAALTVTDLAGRLVLAQPQAASGTTRREVDLHGQPAGIYTLRLATATGTVVRRLVIQ
jgi:hypothetical protein